MKQLSTYHNRNVFWFDCNKSINHLPDNNWVCLAIANRKPDYEKFEKFIRTAVSKNILEFKAHGVFGEELHDNFDGMLSLMEVMEGHSESEVMTTWHNGQTLADAFWQCFHATCLPHNADLDNITVVCTDLDGIDRSAELEEYVKRFKGGWLPEE